MDVIRQSIMCRADLSPMTFFWTPNSRVPETDFNTPHECVNWDGVQEWFNERRVDIYQPGVLNHPVFGKWRRYIPTRPNEMLPKKVTCLM